MLPHELLRPRRAAVVGRSPSVSIVGMWAAHEGAAQHSPTITSSACPAGKAGGRRDAAPCGRPRNYTANPDARRACRLTAAATASGEAMTCTWRRALVIAVYNNCLESSGD